MARGGAKRDVDDSLAIRAAWLHYAAGLTQVEVTAVIQLFIDNVTSHLAGNNEVVLRNFGTFEIRVNQPKVGRNPNNPARAVPIPARTIVKFRPGKELRERALRVLPRMVPTVAEIPRVA